MSLENNLVKLRNTKGMSQENLADLLDVTRQSVSKWENGETMPDTDKLIRISEIFGVTIDFLLKGDSIDNAFKDRSKASEIMSSEVNEKLKNINNMSGNKRFIIGMTMILGFIALVVFIMYIIFKIQFI